MMTANLPPQYLEAEEEFRTAESAEDKLSALKKMLTLIPKHKGTEKMQAEIKKKIAKWKEAAEKQKKRGGGRSDPGHVPREGAAQVAILGPVNAGKSALVAALTNSAPQVADYPFTTRVPQPGMLFHQGIPIQLVDTPALDTSFTERWIATLIRNADLVVLVLDLSRDDLVEQWETCRSVLDSLKIRLIRPREAKRYEEGGTAAIPALYLGNKCQLEDCMGRLEVLGALVPDLPEIRPVSAVTGEGLEAFKERLKEALGLIRVYSKPPGKEADRTAPFILREGATVSDLAVSVSKDLAMKLKFARVWGAKVHAGQRVAMDYALADGDVVELNA